MNHGGCEGHLRLGSYLSHHRRCCCLGLWSKGPAAALYGCTTGAECYCHRVSNPGCCNGSGDARSSGRMKLRLYRKHSIKLMLAWETCRRFFNPLSPRESYLLTNAALGSGILFTYPEIATICGVQGLVVYALSSSLPLLVFAWLGPIIRRKCPEGFVLTEWARQRYGTTTALFLSLLTLVPHVLFDSFHQT